MSQVALARPSVVDALAASLRDQILDGALAPGTPLREVAIAEAFEVSRHTLRSALRQLATEGLVEIRPQRGARVAELDADRLTGLFELRTALEVEAARLALDHGGGRLPEPVHAALRRLVAASRRARPSWRAVSEFHEALHREIVVASRSARIITAYDALAGEMRLFLMQLKPVWSLERMAPHHIELVAALDAGDRDVLRVHIREGLDAVLAPPRP